MIDGWYRVDSGKLLWQKNYQGTLCAKKYQGVLDALRANDQNIDRGFRKTGYISTNILWGSPMVTIKIPRCYGICVSLWKA